MNPFVPRFGWPCFHAAVLGTAVFLDACVQPSLAQMPTETGVDGNGLPALCGTGSGVPKQAPGEWRMEGVLPDGMRSWEVIPSIVRRDGAETFRIEIDVNGPVQSVSLEVPPNLLSLSGRTRIELQDDGLGFDRTAGDYVYTSEALLLNTNWIDPIPFYLGDSNSPPGIDWDDIGLPDIIDLDGTEKEFTIPLQVGSLAPDIPQVGIRQLGADVQASPHFLNVKTQGRCLQSVLRQRSYELERISRPIYSVLQDAFDFLVCISSDHVDNVPVSSANLNCGMHVPVKIDFTGSSHSQTDSTAFYGSSGRLKSFNILDTGWRGVYANNCAHELVHLWAAALDSSFGLNGDYWHYSPRSNIGSLVGGQLWTETAPGKFFMNCDEGRNGAHRAPPLDKYFMGLIEPELVPVSRAYSELMPPPLWMCNEEITNIVAEVPIGEVVARQGLRQPGPATAQREFRIGFVAESRDRLFTASEMTFYDILASWFTKGIPAGEPDPYISRNWVPIERFFGENTRWHSLIESVIAPRVEHIQRTDPSSVTISVTGFPGWSYELWVSGDLHNWGLDGRADANQAGFVKFERAVGSEGSEKRFFRITGQSAE